MNENEEEVFVCVRVFGGEVLTDRTILLGTQDGSAVGKSHCLRLLTFYFT